MKILDLGLTQYKYAYELQKEFVDSIWKGEREDTLIITEHFPVITIGSRGGWNNILKSREFLSREGIEVFEVDRGGNVTYHGPGQIVAYPIFKLENEARDIHSFLRYLEEVGINFLDSYGVKSGRRFGFTGIWIGDEKIGSVGIAVKKWVTYHGVAINIDMAIKGFSFIKPCGIDGVKMSSLSNLLGYRVDIEDAKNRLKDTFRHIPFLAEAVGCK